MRATTLEGSDSCLGERRVPTQDPPLLQTLPHFCGHSGAMSSVDSTTPEGGAAGPRMLSSGDTQPLLDAGEAAGSGRGRSR